ncbi:MAG: tetratricopeptide repeat protein [bacterium]|nr:tetratricopeptide repeat protein [bacterium]
MTVLLDFIKEYYIYIGIGIIFLIAVWGYFKYRRIQNKKTVEKKSHSYVLALNELIAGNNSKAKDLFVEAVRFDTNNIDAYLKLGMLYRLDNNPGKALKIHKELMIRPNLSNSLLVDIYNNIVEDLIDLKNYNEALSYVEKTLSIDPHNKWALEIQPEIYTFKEDWKNAFKFLKTNTEQPETKSRQLAIYKIANGLKLMEVDEFHDARILFKEAIKLDKAYPPPYLLLGEAYSKEERIEDAVKVWREFSEEVPEKAYMVFDFLDQAYFQTGNYGAMEVFYTKLIEQDPDNCKALLKLGEIYFKKGEKDKAFDMTERSLKINPHSPHGLKNLILYLDSKGDLQTIKEKALSLAETVTDKNAYKCNNCGHSTSEIIIKCQECGEWDTYDY